MQHVPMVLFCDECGLGNDPTVSRCASCQHPLDPANSALNIAPITPLTRASAPILEVTPGPLFALDDAKTHVLPSHYPACDFRPGSMLAGRYQIQQEIGRGGFSTVYSAVDCRAGYKRRLVAIKRIQLAKLNPRQVIDTTETFHREITLLPRFKGVNGIPAYYEHLTDAENWYLVTQYIKGQTLEDRLQSAPGGYLSEKETIRLGIELAELLQKLHTSEPPVIFRDLKPANIMLTPAGKFFLIDFGIARNFTPGKAKDTTPLGSPGYAPPEQYGRSQTDQRSDIYSLGATLQTLLTGRDPLDLRAGEIPRNLKPLAPPLRKLLDEMLSPDPALRPANMARVKTMLESVYLRPRNIVLLGAVYGFIASVIALLFPHFMILGIPSQFFLSYIVLSTARIVESLLRSKYNIPLKLPRGFKRFWWLGLLVCFIFFVVGHFLFTRSF
jgi:serine/threonine protein kinase